ncbi:hypothetical protein OHAE_1958 [Ochrobactrum soli]|uniref:Uncharacterized protein n=1 Tax=Ochrobactrum soli TaxID=2448455 RepID=A0A2P9HPR7_9HYPH|nr:hypothetical protein OHAE_1958 [[Ochrobactrum] soli]
MLTTTLQTLLNLPIRRTVPVASRDAAGFPNAIAHRRKPSFKAQPKKDNAVNLAAYPSSKLR